MGKRWYRSPHFKGQPRWFIYWPRGGRIKQVALRIGRDDRPLFSERNQGQNGIPRMWYYAFDKRVSLRITPRVLSGPARR